MKKYIFKSKKLLVLTFLFLTISSILNTGCVFSLKYILDFIDMKDFEKLFSMTIVVLILTIANSVTSYLVEIFKGKYTKNTLRYLKSDLFNKIIKQNPVNFHKYNTAEYLSIFTNDLYIIESDYVNIIFSVYKLILNFLFSVASLAIIDVKITLGTLITGVIVAIIPSLFFNKLSLRKESFSQKQSIFTKKIKDLFTSYETIKVFDIDNIIANQFYSSNEESEKARYELTKSTALLTTISGIFSGLSVLFLFLYSSYLVIEGNISIGSTMAVFQLVQNVISPISSLAVYVSRIQSNKPIINKFNSFVNQDEEKTTLTTFQKFNNQIVFDSVSFSYINGKNVLKDIFFKIEKNKKYVFVGESGSGKSTILKLILGYFHNYEGEILLDGNELKNIEYKSFYKLFSYINQDIFLFDNNIKNNITLFKEYSNEKVIEIIKLVKLHKFLEKKESNLEVNVGENGLNLSGGEKQRIAIARALIKEKPILILDEVTAALDNSTSKDIENLLLNINDVTIIATTHKLSEKILKKYDRIFVVDDGRICEEGSFEELMRCNGAFLKLYNSQ